MTNNNNGEKRRFCSETNALRMAARYRKRQKVLRSKQNSVKTAQRYQRILTSNRQLVWYTTEIIRHSFHKISVTINTNETNTKDLF